MGELRRFRAGLAVVGVLAASGCGPTSSEEGAGPPRFVAVGAEGTIVSSINGARWTTEASGVESTLTAVVAGPALFVAVGSGGTIVTSPDGSSWTRHSSTTTSDLVHVIFTGEKFVAVGGSWDDGAVALKSQDGKTWTQLEAPSDHMFHAVAHGNGALVAAAYYRSDLQTPALFTSALSADGGTASATAWARGEGPDFYDSLDTGDTIAVVGGGSVSTSPDGVTWTEWELPGTALVSGIAWNGSAFVIVGELGTIYSAPALDLPWTERETALGDDLWLGGITHGEPGFVAVGGGGAIVSSPDGAVWTTQVAGTTSALVDVAYGPIVL